MKAAKKKPWSLDQGERAVCQNLSVDGAKILVMRLRQIARGGHQAEWVHGNVGGFSDGRLN
jgi:hypothetical protein